MSLNAAKADYGCKRAWMTKDNERPVLKVVSNDAPKPKRKSGNKVYECRKCAGHFGTDNGPTLALECRSQFDITPRLTISGGKKVFICAYCFARGDVTFITR